MHTDTVRIWFLNKEQTHEAKSVAHLVRHDYHLQKIPQLYFTLTAYWTLFKIHCNTVLPYTHKIHCNTVLPYTHKPCHYFSSANICFAFVITGMHVTSPAHLNHVWTILIIGLFGEKYILRNLTLCNFLHSPVTSSLFQSQTALQLTIHYSSDTTKKTYFVSCFSPTS